jgi:hypothetical protein
MTSLPNMFTRLFIFMAGSSKNQLKDENNSDRRSTSNILEVYQVLHILEDHTICCKRTQYHAYSTSPDNTTLIDHLPQNPNLDPLALQIRQPNKHIITHKYIPLLLRIPHFHLKPAPHHRNPKIQLRRSQIHTQTIPAATPKREPILLEIRVVEPACRREGERRRIDGGVGVKEVCGLHDGCAGGNHIGGVGE